MDIMERIKKQKEDIYFVICAMGKQYSWQEGATIDDVQNAKKIYVSSYEKYLDCIEGNKFAVHENFASQMLEWLPDNKDERCFSFVVKVCYMIAYYYELLVEEMTGVEFNKDDFVYGKNVNDVREEYHQKYLNNVMV